MQQVISDHHQPYTPALGGGGRIASAAYRHALAQCESFQGLDEGINPYELLQLAKRVGKSGGFTPAVISLLEYYFAFTRRLDWSATNRPIVYQSLARTALDLGVSERQIQKLERRLFELGAIGFADSGNHKRFGTRDSQSGRIVFAYGVDLSPLAALRPVLEQKLRDKQLHDKAWLTTKREISAHRRQIRSLLLELRQDGANQASLKSFESDYQAIAIQIRTHLSLQELRSLLNRHNELYSRILEKAMQVNVPTNAKTSAHIPSATKTKKCSCTSEPEFMHSQYTNPVKNNSSPPREKCLQESGVGDSPPSGPIQSSGLPHINLKQALLASSERFREHLPLQSRPLNWNDMVEAAYQLRTHLRISQQSWGEACEVLGRVGASLCVLVTDRATQRADEAVRNPAAYFRAMIRRAGGGELHLSNSICGLIQRTSTGV